MTTFTLTIERPDTIADPQRAVAEIMRQVAAEIETEAPMLASGELRHRLTQEPIASWTVTTGASKAA